MDKVNDRYIEQDFIWEESQLLKNFIKQKILIFYLKHFIFCKYVCKMYTLADI